MVYSDGLNGAKGMADGGKVYLEILNYFYNEVEIG